MIFLTLISLVMIFSFGIGHASAVSVTNGSVIYVNGTSGHDTNNGYTWSTPKLTIKNATGTVATGGTVDIAPGTYTGSGNTNIIISKNMTITGQSQNNTIINGQGTNQIFIINSGVKVTIQNLTLTNGSSPSSGGAISNKGNLTVTSITFKNNINRGKYISTSTGSIFIGGPGGAISNNGILTVTSSIFTNNIATSNGGAIQNNGTLTVTSSIFTNNTAKGNSGGAIQNDGTLNATKGGNGTLTVTGSTFTNNTADVDGGAIGNNGGTWNVTSSTFKGNTAPYGGGAISNNGTLNVNNSTFTNNTAYHGGAYGGAIYNIGGNLNVTISTFKGNTANMGSAIENNGNATLTKNTFTNNTAGYSGGAIFNAGTLNVASSTFTNNTANVGGAISNTNYGTVNVTGSTFTKNIASSYGGAIYNSYGNATLTKNTFTNNTANVGGAIYNYYYNYGTFNVNNSTFTNNTAQVNEYGGGDGGAIGNNGGTWNVTSSTFTNNTAQVNEYDGNGGAIYNSGGTLNVNKSTFTNNTAGYGGAIFNEGTLNVTSSTFTSNNAKYSGGAIFNTYYATATVHYNRIIGNSNYDIYITGGDALYNWWGTNFAGTNPVDAGRINSATSSWMVLSINASPTTILLNGTSTVIANLLYDNKGVYHNPAAGFVPYSGLAGFKTTLGSIANTNFSSGEAKSILKGGTTAGVATVSAKIDNQTVNKFITVTPLNVKSINPPNGAVNVSTNKVINVTFSESIKAGNNWIVLTNSNGTEITFTKTISGNVLTITPTTILAKGVKYTILFHTGCVTDLAGNPLAPTSFSFTTSSV
jgi:autotransporter family porin